MIEILQDNLGGVCIAIGIILIAPGIYKIAKAVYGIYKKARASARPPFE
jgi:hypothetical protein